MSGKKQIDKTIATIKFPFPSSTIITILITMPTILGKIEMNCKHMREIEY